MDNTIALPLARLDDINLSLDRAGTVADLLFSYAAANTGAHPNLAPELWNSTLDSGQSLE